MYTSIACLKYTMLWAAAKVFAQAHISKPNLFIIITTVSESLTAEHTSIEGHGRLILIAELHVTNISTANYIKKTAVLGANLRGDPSRFSYYSQ